MADVDFRAIEKNLIESYKQFIPSPPKTPPAAPKAEEPQLHPMRRKRDVPKRPWFIEGNAGDEE
jgi:hypothetical protein